MSTMSRVLVEDAVVTAAASWSVCRLSPRAAVIEVLPPVVVRVTLMKLTSPVLKRLFEFVLVTSAVSVSLLKATPVAFKQSAPHSATVVASGGVVVRSMADALLLPLLATRATPSRGSTATPSGVVPGEIAGGITPTGPSDSGDSWPLTGER